MTSPRRIAFIGNTSAGKSTLAAELARRLDVPHIELDALYWEPNWVGAEREVFRARVDAATGVEGWTSSGNYLTAVQDLVWGRADTVVWLDYPLRVLVPRLWGRTYRRWRDGELLWGTNRENVWQHFKLWNQEQSLVAFQLRQQLPKRRRYEAEMRDPCWAHVTFERLRSPREAEAWLERTTAARTTA
ncbi:MAG: adenylate kinase [Dehalococcoidia bacterium]